MNMNKNQGQSCPYFIGKSKVILYNQSELIKITEKCYSIHQDYFPGKHSTWTYPGYNFWGLSSANELMYSLYDELSVVTYKDTLHATSDESLVNDALKVIK